ncbi:hypothetical protein ABI59_16360 [Acidobacteria bacterium Mor1]|nr:hypothetical protein ABI59_16360 [Acidobacteria bacterium Mor1]
MREPSTTRVRPALWAVALIWIGSILALATPLVTPAWSGEASLFGLPRSLIWVLGWLTAMFVSLVWAYRSEPVDDGEAP